MITVSIVSHGQAYMLDHLLESLIDFPEVDKIIVTLNIPEILRCSESSKLVIVENTSPKGFGANHNAAFRHSTDYFCVLNPDIEIRHNPFPKLMEILEKPDIGIVAPLVVSDSGEIEDSGREFFSPYSLLKRQIVKLLKGKKSLGLEDISTDPDWVAGMFMVFRNNVFEEVEGFDNGFHLYCEDVDICARTCLHGYHIRLCKEVAVVHRAQRKSHSSLKYFFWHCSSLVRLFIKYGNGYPSNLMQIRRQNFRGWPWKD